MTIFSSSGINTKADRKNFNTFYHPMGGPGDGGTDGVYDSGREIQFQVQIFLY